MFAPSSIIPMRQSTYKEYLRECSIYQEFKDISNLKPFQLEVKRPKAQLCNLNFLQGHECIFSLYCIFSHSITDIEDMINEVELKNVPQSQKRIFHHLGVWPTTCILSFFS
mmetsp:Transcript_3722/g.3652  ORF Transcript_3722/g.3652 Transcript_3722/m.3652 type:complete len:111 (-) Transcript_3722:1408-1740(-)